MQTKFLLFKCREPCAEDWDDELRNCSSFHTVPERDVQEEYHPRMQYLSLDIPTDRIFFVDDEKSLRMCQEILSKVSRADGSQQGDWD